MKKYLIVLILLFITNIFGQEKKSNPVKWRVSMGLNFGATTPLPKPSEVTKIYAWYPKVNPSFNVMAIQKFGKSKKNGVAFGFTLERKSFSTTTSVNKLPINVEGEKLFFSGNQNTTFDSRYLGVLMAYTRSFHNNKIDLYSGFFMNLLLGADFIIKLDGDGKVSDGTESSALNAGTMVKRIFSDQVNPMELGYTIGSDFFITKNIGVTLRFNIGLTNTNNEEFYKLTKHNLHNLYAYTGICYKFE